MTYLVTGGTGFIGAHIVRLLKREGKNVVAYDIAPDNDSLARVLGEKSDSIEIITGDITDMDHLRHTCKAYGINRIIHAAAIIGSENPPMTVRVNCDGTINILEVSRILGIERVVLTGSVSVFGPPSKYKEEFIPNDAPHYPQTIYGATKSFIESCANYYFNEYGIDVITIRLAHVYGMGRKTKGIGKTIDEELFIKPALGKAGKVPFGEDIHNFIYVEDAARAMVMAGKAKPPKTRAFTAAGHIASIEQVAAIIRDLTPGAEITLLPGSADWSYKFDTTPIREQIGYSPEWTVEQGSQAFIKNIQRSGHLINEA